MIIILFCKIYMHNLLLLYITIENNTVIYIMRKQILYNYCKLSLLRNFDKIFIIHSNLFNLIFEKLICYI